MLATFALPASCDLALAPRAATLRVRSADELRHALRQSRDRPLTVDASALDRVLRLDAARELIEVQAATTWAALAGYLSARGLEPFAACEGLPAGIGDAVSRNAAGPDGLPVSAHVAALTLVTPEGELRRADRELNAKLFALVLGGQGLFGVLYSVTLRIDSLERSARAAQACAELELAPPPTAGVPASELECLLPPEQLERFLAAVRALAGEQRLALHSITVRRLLPEADSRLRWATREWAGVRLRFSPRATLGAAVRAAEVRRLLLGLALEHGGSFPACDSRDASREQLEACYPMLAAFLAEQRRVDPGERLQCEWLRQVRAALRREACAVRWGA